MTGPRWLPEEGCEYIGTVEWAFRVYDVYERVDEVEDTIVCRYSNFPSDYLSGRGFRSTEYLLDQAKKQRSEV